MVWYVPLEVSPGVPWSLKMCLFGFTMSFGHICFHSKETNWGSRFWLAIRRGLDTNSLRNLCASCLMDFLFKTKYWQSKIGLLFESDFIVVLIQKKKTKGKNWFVVEFCRLGVFSKTRIACFCFISNILFVVWHRKSITKVEGFWKPDPSKQSAFQDKYSMLPSEAFLQSFN